MASQESVDEWLDWMLRVRRASTGTVAQYGATMRAFCGFTAAEWGEVTPQMIEAFLLRERKRMAVASPATQQRERATIKSFYAFAIRRGMVSSDPTFDVPMVKVHNGIPRAVDDRTWRTLWLSDMPRSDRVWVGILAFAGLRRREVVSLAPHQIDLDRGLLRGVVRKGGAVDVIEFAEMARILSLRLPHLLPDLDAWLDDVRWLVGSLEGEDSIIQFGNLLSSDARFRHGMTPERNLVLPNALNFALRRLLRHAGLSETAFSPHALRHTCATNLLRCGVPIEVVADALGHSSPLMTMRYSKTAGRLAEWRVRTQPDHW